MYAREPMNETLAERSARFDRPALLQRCLHNIEARLPPAHPWGALLTALALARAERAGLETQRSARALLRAAFRERLEGVGLLALATWAAAEVEPEWAAPPALALRAAIDRPLQGLSGADAALALVAARLVGDELTASTLREAALYRWWNPGAALFDQIAGADAFMRSQALFSTQIHWVHALALCEDDEAQRIARECTHRLVELRDEFGGWPWRIDASSGACIEAYPQSTRAQLALAPLALGALGGFDDALAQSLSWAQHNVTGEDLLGPDLARGLRRRFGSAQEDRDTRLHVDRSHDPELEAWILIGL